MAYKENGLLNVAQNPTKYGTAAANTAEKQLNEMAQNGNKVAEQMLSKMYPGAFEVAKEMIEDYSAWTTYSNNEAAEQAFNQSMAATLQAQKYNAEEAQKNRDFEERMSNTSYQRAVQDMIKAGINPILAASQGGASTPAGSTATSSAASSYMAKTNETLQNMSLILGVIESLFSAGGNTETSAGKYMLKAYENLEDKITENTTKLKKELYSSAKASYNDPLENIPYYMQGLFKN